MASWADGAVNELIAASGGDYTTLSAFEGAHDGETPTNGTICKARIKGSIAGQVYWTGWQSGQNDTTYIVVEAEDGCETDGLTDAAGDDAAITDQQVIYETSVTLNMVWSKIQFSNSSTTPIFLVNADGGGWINVCNCLFIDSPGRGFHLIDVDTNQYDVRIGGCFFRNCGTALYRRVIDSRDSLCSCTVYNSTIYGGRVGVYEYADGTVKTRNVAVCGTTTSDYYSVSDEDYCASEDATATGGHSTTALTVTASDDFTDIANDDATIYDSNSVLYYTGVAIADSWFTTFCPTDFSGTSWASPPSIGCFEVVGAQPPSGSPWYVYAQQ